MGPGDPFGTASEEGPASSPIEAPKKSRAEPAKGTVAKTEQRDLRLLYPLGALLGVAFGLIGILAGPGEAFAVAFSGLLGLLAAHLLRKASSGELDLRAAADALLRRKPHPPTEHESKEM